MFLLVTAALGAPCAIVADDHYVTAASVTFQTSSAELAEEGLAAASELACILKAEPKHVLHIGVHTDARGSGAYNQAMSQKRADALRAALLAAGVAEGQVRSRGYGEAYPIETNATEAGRTANRRVELLTADPGRPEIAGPPAPVAPVAPEPAGPTPGERLCREVEAKLSGGAELRSPLSPDRAATALRGCLEGFTADQDGVEWYLVRDPASVVIRPDGSGSLLTISQTEG